MSLIDHVQEDLIAAMRARDALRLGTLRMIKTALKNKQVETGMSLSEDQERSVLQTLVKQRREAATQFREGGRLELAEKEELEMQMIGQYLPSAATDEEIEAAIRQAVDETGATSPRDMGRVMKATLAGLASKTVDGGHVSALVRQRLQSE